MFVVEMFAVSSFNTEEVHPWNNPRQKTSKTIDFPQTYVAPPRLVTGLKSLDMRGGTSTTDIGIALFKPFGVRSNTNLRVKAYPSGTDSKRYTANIDTWYDTTLYSACTDTLILGPANLDVLCGQFSTEEDHLWNLPKPQTSRRINFERPFTTPPKVVVFLNQFDSSGSSTRVKTYTSGVDAKGFTIHIDTWADTTLYSATAGWVAYPEDKEFIYSGTANTTEIRPWQQPQTLHSKRVTFGSRPFVQPPKVFVALNSIDISTDTNLRVRAYVSGVNPESMSWHIDSWADTKLWSAGISYIAFN
ncbi:hypothetical protein FRC01_003397 [Tulasnella sp. 417]|nr:hypothetical protein FRC01_003397 [Tulasnella sp. 417]